MIARNTYRWRRCFNAVCSDWFKAINTRKTPQAALFCAVFFVASLIHLPAFLTASSVHLILSGLMGITLGWAVFPAVAIAILLQAVFFGYGGILVLGVNVFNIAFPALLVGLAFRKFALNKGLTAKMLAL
ncbi:hypothetical protein AT251_20130 [Enterovibrio nigricans]|nr:hypothetical protein AT251_20130 [Enterovibrio nigricans]